MAQHHTLVFVVDDDEAVRESLQALLEAAGYVVQTYRSGLEFLTTCKNDKGSGCVLLDARMPHMNGLEVLQRLQDVRPDLPVVMITGGGDVEMAKEAMKAGAVDFIEKPVLEEQLLSSINGAFALIADQAGKIA